MPAPILTRDEVVGRLLETFRREGYDGASLASLSAATGLGKSSLYHHFPGGKEDMAHAVLDAVDSWIGQEILVPLRGDGTAEARLARALAALDGLYEGGTKACILERLCASVDRHQFQARLRGAFGDWIAALADLLISTGVARTEARARAEDAVVRIEGSLVLAAGLGDPAPFRRTLRGLRSTFLSPHRRLSARSSKASPR